MRGPKRKRCKALNKLSIMCICAIGMLSAMGVSYGAWENQIKMSNSISLGNIDPKFTDCYLQNLAGNNPDNYLNATIEDRGKTIKITGKVTEGSNFNAHFKFTIVNGGSLSILCKEPEDLPQEMLKINNNRIEKGKSENGSFKFKSDDLDKINEKDVKITVDQWNMARKK